MAHRVVIVALPGTFVLDLAVAAQAFGRRPSVFSKIRDETEERYEVRVCGGGALGTSLGFSMSELGPLSELADADTVIVPGLEAPWVPQDPGLLEAVATAAARGARMVSLCAGAFVLGQAGVLDGRRVTTHWALAEEFRAAFPAAELVEHAMYVDDGSVLTSGGMLASADLCLHILRLDHGQAYANDVSRILISPPHRVGGQAKYATDRDTPGDWSPSAGNGVDARQPRGTTEPADRGSTCAHEPPHPRTAVPNRDGREPPGMDLAAEGRTGAGTAGGDGPDHHERSSHVGVRIHPGDASALPPAHGREPTRLPRGLPAAPARVSSRGARLVLLVG